MSGPRSMTGFGRADGEWRGGKVTVEIKSVNHRYFEARMRFPRDVASLEPLAGEWLRSRKGRGRFDVTVSVGGMAEPVFKAELNLAMAKQYIDLYRKVAWEVGSKTDPNPDPGLILQMRDVILSVEQDIDLKAEWAAIEPVFAEALDKLDEAASIEGAKLAADMKARLDKIADFVEKIESLRPNELKAYRDRLAARIEQLLENVEIDEDRLAQELAYTAERSDFTEEIIRLRAHLGRFNEILESDGPVGRTMDFLAQEILREINTTSSKALSAGICQMAVEMKAELEKIREQVQNIE